MDDKFKHVTVVIGKYYLETLQKEADDLRKAADDILFDAMMDGYTYKCTNWSGSTSVRLLDMLYLTRNIVD